MHGGERESIEELYRNRYASFRSGLAAITGTYETARDVVHEAFAQALRDHERFRDDGPLAAWVLRIAFRIALGLLDDEAIQVLPSPRISEKGGPSSTTAPAA